MFALQTRWLSSFLLVRHKAFGACDCYAYFSDESIAYLPSLFSVCGTVLETFLARCSKNGNLAPP
ncbi:hypothetical protein HMPREF1988_00466 [Porphyromonas gingivalis F0185]|nr:hypothetical protein HMPREF1988_00466 [Porphyromonas gingivalis F0185]